MLSEPEKTKCPNCGTEFPAAALLCPSCARANISSDFAVRTPASSGATAHEEKSYYANLHAFETAETPEGAAGVPTVGGALKVTSMGIPVTTLPWEINAPQKAQQGDYTQNTYDYTARPVWMSDQQGAAGPQPAQAADAEVSAQKAEVAKLASVLNQATGQPVPVPVPQSRYYQAGNRPFPVQLRTPEPPAQGRFDRRNPRSTYPYASPSNRARRNKGNTLSMDASPYVATALEMLGYLGFLGVGHVYAGRYRRGFTIMLFWWLWLVELSLGAGWSQLGCIAPLSLLAPVVSAAAIWHDFKQNRRR